MSVPDPTERLSDEYHADAASRLRHEIALRAARLIAEDGLDYGGAKRRAARDLLGKQRVPGDMLPDNALIEAEVRSYQELFQSETQPARLLHLRLLALRIMEFLNDFSPFLVGAVANGTAGEHSDIHLQLYCDSAKDVEMLLLNHGLDFEADDDRSASQRHAGAIEEVLHVLWRERGHAPEGLHISVHTQEHPSATGSERRGERLSLAALRLLLKDQETIK
jgi:hypothetical protein